MSTGYIPDCEAVTSNGMKWANFLHIYQPADQQPDIIEAIVVQCYRPLLEGFKENKKIRITMNVAGSLLELFDKNGYADLIDIMRYLVKEGRLELTGSAKYHAFLPFLDESEIVRQIVLNTETLQLFFGKEFQPKGFFPPEMAFSNKLTPIIEAEGFKWMIIDEIAKTGFVEQIDYTKTYRIKDSGLLVYFRERRPSNLIMSAVVRSAKTLEEAMKNDLASDRYVLTAMDGETFGHHRPGLDKMLFEVLKSKKFSSITISEITNYYKNQEEVSPLESTWASSRQDIEKGTQFLSWSDLENSIHKWQWQLVKMVLETVHTLDKNNPNYNEVRSKMDIALASDHLWWASAKPWWSVEMIELGANRLLTLARSIPGISNDKLSMASNLYEKIISTAFLWQRTGKIRQMAKTTTALNRIAFKDRTWGLGDVGGATYKAFIAMMHDLEKKAAKKGEYEKAILWRDAIWRLENKTDIYETVNAIDLLRTEIPNEQVEKIIEEYREEYRRIRGGQPEQRGS